MSEILLAELYAEQPDGWMHDPDGFDPWADDDFAPLPIREGGRDMIAEAVECLREEIDAAVSAAFAELVEGSV